MGIVLHFVGILMIVSGIAYIAPIIGSLIVCAILDKRNKRC